MSFSRSLRIPHIVQTQHAASSPVIVLVTLFGIISQNTQALGEATQSTLEERVRASIYRIEDESRNGTCGVIVSDGTQRVFLISTLHGLRSLSGERAWCYRYTKHRCGCFTPSGLVFDGFLRDGTRELWFSSSGSGIAIMPTTLPPILFHESPIVGLADLISLNELVSDISGADRLQVFGYPVTARGCFDPANHTTNATIVSVADKETVQGVSRKTAVSLAALLRADYEVTTSNWSFSGSPCFSSRGIVGFHMDSLAPKQGSALLLASEAKSFILSIEEEDYQEIKKAAVVVSKRTKSLGFRECVKKSPPEATFPLSRESSFEDVIRQTTLRIEDDLGNGATGIVISGLDGDAVFVTNRHVLVGWRQTTANLRRPRKCECGCFEPDYYHKIQIYDGTQPLWIGSSESDVAAVPLDETCGTIMRHLGTQRLIDSDSLIMLSSLEAFAKTSGGIGKVWGYPMDTRNCIIGEAQAIPVLNLSKTTVQAVNENGILFGPADWWVADYYIPDSIGGNSGSPVFLKDRLIGIHSGRHHESRQSIIVPADYIVDVLETLHRCLEGAGASN